MLSSSRQRTRSQLHSPGIQLPLIQNFKAPLTSTSSNLTAITRQVRPMSLTSVAVRACFVFHITRSNNCTASMRVRLRRGLGRLSSIMSCTTDARFPPSLCAPPQPAHPCREKCASPCAVASMLCSSTHHSCTRPSQSSLLSMLVQVPATTAFHRLSHLCNRNRLPPRLRQPPRTRL